jgi:hypothetical protein
MSLSAPTESLANPTTVPELQMQRDVANRGPEEMPLMETDSLSEASSTSIEEEQQEEMAASPHEDQDEGQDEGQAECQAECQDDEDSIDDRDLPDDVIHSVTLRTANNELMTFTLRTAEKGLQVVDISGGTPITLSAEAFQGIVEDLFYDVKKEEERREWTASQLEVWEDQRKNEFELLLTFTKIFGSFFLFLLILVSIARVL